jgi:hypothetical protein
MSTIKDPEMALVTNADQILERREDHPTYFLLESYSLEYLLALGSMLA